MKVVNSELKALQLKARQQVYTLLSGHNLSKLYAEGYDFAELREYQRGDDIRKINWTITAKLGKPYIKELHTNRELSVVVSTFMDGSLYFGTENKKQKKLTEVATILGYATQFNGDLFTGISYTQTEINVTPPTKQLYHIESFSNLLFETSLLDTKIDMNISIEDLFSQLYRPSLLFVISDFLEPVDLSLLAQKHEVIAIIIRNKEEETLQKLGEVTLKNPQNKAKLDTYFGKKSAKKYHTRLKAHDTRLIEHFSQNNIRYVKIFTEDEAVKKLLSLFV